MSKSPTNKLGAIRSSAMLASDAGVECGSKWIASCDTHGCFIECRSKRDAQLVAKHTEDFCDDCRELLGEEGR